MSQPLFRSVLIANRGEISCRILRTLRRMGIQGVAVFHREDRPSPHVAAADVALEIDGSTPTAAYLDSEQIVATAKAAGVEAIHPGYGFLAENADFAERVVAAGLSFIGPRPEVIRLMGDKVHARDFVVKHGFPVLPSVVQTGNLESFCTEASRLRFPLLIKAAAGGGGKGMIIVRTREELLEKAPLAAGEAKRYFADGRIYTERYIERPRHIEVQVLGDGEGGAIHLFERECSIQRRFQKIIEEAPSPTLSPALRDTICHTAVGITRAARYTNAGTIEFILAPDDTFYFLEMNTRLQVEHPVTELTTGLDLVAEQLFIAAGQGLRLRQDDVSARGHAIECRISAEDPDHDFIPATGRVALLRAPEGEGVRFDSGIREGQDITPSFDPMLAKLIVWGDNRETAITRMTRALEELVLLGVQTNVDYLARIMRDEAFHAGALHTGFVVERATALCPADVDDETQAAALVAAALGIEDFRRLVSEVPEPYASINRWRN